MNLRAWHNWLRTISPEPRRRRSPGSPLAAEGLELRILPATGLITVANGDDIDVRVEAGNVIFERNGSTTTVGTVADVTLLQITCSGSSSSASNTIQINLSSADGLAGGFQITVTGNGGADLIDASQTDVPVSLSGGTGNDTLIGGSGNDTLDGGAGADSLTGGDGDDNLTGGTGSDVLAGEGGDDVCLGGDSADNVSGGTGNDIVNGQGGNDTVTGDDGNDYVYGGAGRDYVDGGDGSDIVKGQGGRDTITGSYADAVAEAAAFQALDASEAHRGTDTILANVDTRDRNEYEA